MPKSKGSGAQNVVTIVQYDPQLWKRTCLIEVGLLKNEATARKHWTRGSRGNKYPDFLFLSFLPLTLSVHPLSKSNRKPVGRGALIMQFIEVSLYKA